MLVINALVLATKLGMHPIRMNSACSFHLPCNVEVALTGGLDKEVMKPEKDLQWKLSVRYVCSSLN